MKKTITTYLDRRLAGVFFNGMASGFPWIIIGSALTLWLKDLGLTRTAIGFFGSVFAVYSLNWIWAPLLDRVRLPLLGKLGQRRSWLLLLQALLFALILFIAQSDGGNLIGLSLLALSVASVSATQDVVIDAYRIDAVGLHETKKLSAGAALATAGWWSGYGFIGAVALYLSDFGMPWNAVYFVLAFFVPLFMLNTLLLREPESARFETQREIQAAYQNAIGGAGLVSKFLAWCLTTLVEPLRDFFTRFGGVAILIFAFIMFFKIGEAFLGRMSLLFYKEIGFTSAEIATYSKLAGSGLTVLFSIVAGMVSVQYGLVRGLMLGGVAMAATNLIFAYMATTGADTAVFAAAIFFDNFTSAFSTVAFVAFISHLTNRTYTASQYALMSSLGNFGRTVFAGGSGWLVDSLHGDWFVFFIITALMVLPSLCMLHYIGKKLRALFAQT